jgi:hypothetical protein
MLSRMTTQPASRCPSCGHSIPLADTAAKGAACPACKNIIAPTDLDYRMHGYLSATESVVMRGSKRERRSDSAGYDLLAESGEALLRIAPFNPAEHAGADGGALAPEVARMLKGVLGQLPGLAADATRLGMSASRVSVRVAPALALKLAGGGAEFMKATGGGFRANIVNVVGGAVLGQATLVPASLATVGALAAWQALSFAVAQKHLYDINRRLDEINKKVDEILDVLRSRSKHELQGDAQSLDSHAKGLAHADVTDPVVRAEYRAKISPSLDRSRHRHAELLSNVQRTFGSQKQEAAVWFGKTLTTARQQVEANLSEFHDAVFAAYANLLVELFALKLYAAVDDQTAFVDQRLKLLNGDLESLDKLFRTYHEKLSAQLPGLRPIVRTQGAGAEARAAIGKAHWERAQHVAAVQDTIGSAVESFRAPQLVVDLQDGEIGEVRLLTSASFAFA